MEEFISASECETMLETLCGLCQNQIQSEWGYNSAENFTSSKNSPVHLLIELNSTVGS